MTAPLDREWARLSRTWRGLEAREAGEADYGALMTWVRQWRARHRRRLLWITAAEVGITLLMAGAVLWVLLRWREPVSIAFAAAAVVHAMIVWAFTLWNRRGLWRPLGETTRDYLSTALLWSRRQMQAAGFTAVLVSVEMVVVLLWAGLASPAARPVTPWSGFGWVGPAAITVVALGWALWYRNRARVRLTALERLRRSLELE